MIQTSKGLQSHLSEIIYPSPRKKSKQIVGDVENPHPFYPSHHPVAKKD